MALRESWIHVMTSILLSEGASVDVTRKSPTPLSLTHQTDIPAITRAALVTRHYGISS